MTEFIQMHMLVSYPPSNLNRDDLGRPKTAMMGGSQRLRISSQSLKRAWRTSSIFQEKLDGHIGIRTKEMGIAIYKAIISKKDLTEILESKTNYIVDTTNIDKKAKECAKKIATVFGKNKKENTSNPFIDLEIEQLAHFSTEEIHVINEVVNDFVQTGKIPDEKVSLLRKNHKAVDIAMFGRMLADNPGYNTEAAVQVAHAITVNEVAVEDDYFTAVDDLNNGEEDMGAAHIGENEFASGLYYTYICINRTLLKENLSDDEELTKKALKALVEAATKVAPSGKQNSFASRAYASYLLVEKGTQQPRSLSVAFLEAVRDKSLLNRAIATLKDTNKKMEEVYGKCSADQKEMNAYTGEGSLEQILSFVEEPLQA